MSRWISWLPSGPAGASSPPAAVGEIEELRRQMLAALDDCRSAACGKLRARLQGVRSHQELWHARVELFHVVAREYCESRATERIAALTGGGCARPR